jgi:hypothetical protein
VGGLQGLAIAHGPKDDANGAGIIETVAPNGISQAKRLQAAHFDGISRCEFDMAIEHRFFARLSTGPHLTDQDLGHPAVNGV